MSDLRSFVCTSLLAVTLGGVPAFAVAAAHPSPPQERRVNENAQAIADFQEEIQEYVALHRKLEKTLPELPKEATPEQIDQRQRELAALIQKARRGEGPGDIFERDVRPVIRRILFAVFTGPDGKKLRMAVNEENPGQAVRLTVNGRYPDTIPISTVPPQVLKALPLLPPELEYRFIGSTLILLDAYAHIIVDYMTGVVPR
jgi:septal ring factor EnvC (AmiA/AmiB activator)